MEKRRKRKKRILWWPIVLISIFAVILISVFVGLLYYVQTESVRAIQGSWSREIDLTDQAQGAAQDWLNEALMGNQISAADYLQKEYAQIVLTFGESDWAEAISAEKYQALTDKCYEELAQATEELVKIRLSSAGIEADPEELIQSALGMSFKDYLLQYGPTLLPELSELQSAYEKNGNYVVDHGLLYRGQGEGEELLAETGETFMADSYLVILPTVEGENPVYYSRLEDGNVAGGEPILVESISKLAGEFADEIISTFEPMQALAGGAFPSNLTLEVEGGKHGTVRALEADYAANYYVSLRDVAALLAGTEKAFKIGVNSDSIEITLGSSYSEVGGENVPFSEEELAEGTTNCRTAANKMNKNGEPVTYYTILTQNSEGKSDCYMSLLDLSMCMDLNLTIEGTVLSINPANGFVVDASDFEEGGAFFDMVNSALVGDATTGQILFESDAEESVAMASTTKLMTYLVVMDAVSGGEISLSDIVAASANAEALSQTSDAVVSLEQGQEVCVSDLLKAMLLGSSNECALMLAEHVGGTEEAFVLRMNERAKELGMSEGTVFNNCNGLPVYEGDIVATKKQNMITAEDMFVLTKYIFAVYPQIEEITSIKKIQIDSLHKEIKNTNPTLFNKDGVIGLKTGTTDRAGACLVSAMKVPIGEEEHVIVAMEFGAENSATRARVTELLLYFGEQILAGEPLEEAGEMIPTGVEELVQVLIKEGRK